jgi:hypothetical protein
LDPVIVLPCLGTLASPFQILPRKTHFEHVCKTLT